MLNMAAAVELMSRQAKQPQQQIFPNILAMMLETSSGLGRSEACLKMCGGMHSKRCLKYLVALMAIDVSRV